MDIDLARLAKGNLLGKELAKKAGYKKTKYFQFLQDHAFNSTNQDIKPYLNDILYAKSILPPLCQLYKKLIFKETNKILKHMTDEEKLSIGYEAIWRALHNYTNPKTNITQWLMFGIRMYAHKNRKLIPTEFTILDSLTTFIPDRKQPKPDLEPNENQLLELWQKKIGIKDEDKIMLNFFLTKEAYTKEGWIKTYLSDLKSRTGQTLSKQYITLRINNIKKRLAKYLGIDMSLAV